MSQVSSTAVGEVDVPGQFVARHAILRAPVDTCQRPESTSQAAMVIANHPTQSSQRNLRLVDKSRRSANRGAAHFEFRWCALRRVKGTNE